MQASPNTHRALALSRLLALVFAVAVATVASGATFVVTTPADDTDLTPGDGSCSTVGFGIPACTLRAAIQEANALAGPDRIEVPALFIPRTEIGHDEDAGATGDLDILDDLLIVGDPGGGTVVHAMGHDRVFHVAAGVQVRFENVAVMGGVVDATVGGASGGGGGGILADAGSEVTLVRVEVTGNTAAHVGPGSDAVGGGVRAESARLELRDCRVSDNAATTTGGGISVIGRLRMRRTTIERNFADAGAGVRLGATDSASSVTASTVRDNVATAGGGLYAFSLGGPHAVAVKNSTFSGNRGSSQGGGIHANGLVDPIELRLRHVTVAGNRTTWATSAGGGISADGPGATVRVASSIVAGNQDASGTAPDLSGSGFLSDGHDVIGVADGSDFVARGSDQAGTLAAPLDARLRPLRDNGGPTATHALRRASPAVDAADAAACPNRDQRGVARPQDGDRDGIATCDVGSFELE